ncbi:hypothetical protein AB1L88_19685 [Tautonia sp. JC769]|uniref:hypothetical protein n=1 Tax=Tautonia sp. JC769 TaxID=3232135 RepID=UPI00345B0674
MYLGKRHVVSCRQLADWAGIPVPETKEGSYQVADRWWTAKRAEIDGQKPAHPQSERIAELRSRAAYERRHGRPGSAAAIEEEAIGLESGTIEPPPKEPSFHIWWDEFPEVQELIWKDRLANDRSANVPADRTVGALVDRFLERERSRVGSDLSPGGYANVRDRLAHLRGWLDNATAIDQFDADAWDKYYVFVLRKEWSSEHKRGVFRAARSFVSWLADMGVIPRPANLDRRYQFLDLRDDDDADIVPMPVADVRKLAKAAEGTQTELYLLLMANCGFTSLDVSDLHPDEVRDGRIVRRRSKTRRYRRPPLVDYKLWPRTATLLDRFRTADPDHVLLSERGTPLAGRRLDEAEKVRRKDNVALAIRRLSKKLGVAHPPKAIRKRSATLIREDSRYADLRGHFLGHAPESIADGYYAAPPQGRFDECIDWLGEQYGLMGR